MNTEDLEFQRIEREQQMRNKTEPKRYCYWVSDDENCTVCESLSDAHGEAQQYLWDNYETGDEISYNVAEVQHPLEMLTPMQRKWFTDNVIESINEQLHDEVGGDDEALEFDAADQKDLIDHVFKFFMERGKVNRWGINEKTTITVKHIVGSDR